MIVCLFFERLAYAKARKREGTIDKGKIKSLIVVYFAFTLTKQKGKKWKVLQINLQ